MKKKFSSKTKKQERRKIGARERWQDKKEE
jgi:hypothetical protein